jgi:HPt (histidine-containing phosphotransfer) domain-containing protein
MSRASLESLSSVIDHRALLTRCLNKLDFAERMLALFQSRCGEELEELDQAFEKADLEAVRRISHRLGGACANAAAFGLQACATDLRHAANDGSLDKASQCLAELRREWDRFTTVMSAEQNPPSPETS